MKKLYLLCIMLILGMQSALHGAAQAVRRLIPAAQQCGKQLAQQSGRHFGLYQSKACAKIAGTNQSSRFYGQTKAGQGWFNNKRYPLVAVGALTGISFAKGLSDAVLAEENNETSKNDNSFDQRNSMAALLPESEINMLQKIAAQNDIEKIQKEVHALVGDNKEKLLSLAKEALNKDQPELFMYLAASQVDSKNKFINPHAVLNGMYSMYYDIYLSKLYPEPETGSQKKVIVTQEQAKTLGKEVREFIDQAAQKGNLYAQFLQIYDDDYRNIRISVDARLNLLPIHDFNYARGFFTAARLHKLLKKDPTNKQFRYALGLNLLAAGHKGNDWNMVEQGLKLMDESGYLKLRINDELKWALQKGAPYYKEKLRDMDRNEIGLIRVGDIIVAADGTILIPSYELWNNVKQKFIRTKPIAPWRFNLLENYADKLDSLANTLRAHDIRIKQVNKKNIDIYSAEDEKSRKVLGRIKVPLPEDMVGYRLVTYRCAQNDPEINAVLDFLLDALERSHDARSVRLLIDRLKGIN